MQKLILSLLILFTSGAIYGQDANTIVDQVLSRLDSLSPYRAEIEVKYGKDSISGFYEVEGDNYYISVDQQELYGDSSVKYEVFNSRKEVVIDKVSPDFNGNILNNPATAFAAIKQHYAATITGENKEVAIINLKPLIGDDGSIETIDLHISKESQLPTSIIYQLGDERIIIDIIDIDKISTITRYNSNNYADYEVIDFR